MPRLIRSLFRGRSPSRAAALGLGLSAVVLTGCDDLISGPGLTEDPNNPTTATAEQLFVAAEASLINQQEGQLARIASFWTQQLSGTNNQQLNYGSQYLITEGDVSTFWGQIYSGGGVVDLRKMRALGAEAGDQKMQGLSLFIEAFRIGTTASLWGDIPYSQVSNDTIRTPKLDPQQEVYAAVQLKLDTAITLLRGTGSGPFSGADVFYAGNYDRWVRAAYTLKARYHMHTGERLGNPAYTAALAAANQGINEAPTTVNDAIHGQAPGNFRPLHGNSASDGNLWAQFLGSRADVTANQQFIALLQSRNDPRLAAYFDPATDGQYRGSSQFGVVPGAGASNVDVATRLQLTFRQPFITWAENQLIIAEASFRLGTGNPLANVNAVRQAVGLPALAGPITLNQIAEEKYISEFQNIEAYNDFKRNCYPLLTPGGSGNTSAAAIPGRLPYALTERQANPNIPLPNAAPSRNWNDPNACPRP